MFAKQITFFAAVLPVAMAHIGLFDPAAFDFDGNGYSLVEPLANLPFDRWWFHGNKNKQPKAGVAPVNLPAGGKVTLQFSCNKRFTSFGGGGSNNNPCPSDTPSMHAGTPINDNALLGCGLAIAYKSDVNQVQPADFTIFTVNTQCVKTLRTDFQVPKDMPPCPNGKCVCAWFWQGQNSANEMYMTGFNCNVSGGNANAKIGAPKPPVYCKGDKNKCVKGAKQPEYWANDRSNIKFEGYDKKPAYNANWGYMDGAQTDIFTSGGGSGGNTNPQPTANPPPATTLATSTKKSTPAPTSAPSTCSWPGHCAGATCKTYNDCSDDLTCISGKCAKK